MGSPMALSNLALNDLEISNSMSLRFRGLISCTKLVRAYVTIKDKQETIYGEANGTFKFDFE